jgi:hypothetical protein
VSGTDDALWNGVEALAARAPGVRALKAHGLQLFRVRSRRRAGLPVAEELARDERLAALTAATAPLLLRCVRDALPGRVLLLKGPEVAARFPDPALRPFKDLDLLVEDPQTAQRMLIARGFREVGSPRLYRGIHHLRPLHLPGQPLLVELHARPKTPPWVEPPPAAELIARAVPSSTGVDGVETVPPDEHALLVACHGWSHGPLRRALDIVDVLAVAAETPRARLDALASCWRMEELWRATIAAAEAVLLGRGLPWTLRTFARPLLAARDQTVLEGHLESLLAPFAGLSARPACALAATRLRGDLRPAQGETWGGKARRSGFALRRAFEPRRDHEQKLAMAALAGARARPGRGASCPR